MQLRRGFAVCAVLLCFAAELGCSGDGDPDVPPWSPMSAADGGGDEDAGPYKGGVDAGAPDAGSRPDEVIGDTEACRRYVAYYCGRLLSCGLRELQYARGCYSGADLCPDLMFSPGSTRTAKDVLACGKAWLDHPCDEVRHSRAPQCGATPGTRAAGEPCITAAQCKSSRCTGYLGAGTCGMCIDQAASGGSCGANVVCPYDESCVSGTCQPSALPEPGEPAVMTPPGELCEFSYDKNYGGCALGTACFAKSASEQDRCNYLPGPGEACYDSLCWGAGHCTARTCAEVFPCGANGMTCEQGSVCVCRDASCSWQVCAARRQEGERCAFPAVPCADRLECVEGLCMRKDLPSRYDELCN